MKTTAQQLDPCRACPMAGLCDSDECGMKLFYLDSNRAPKFTGTIKLPRYNDEPIAKVVPLNFSRNIIAVQLKFNF